jgi:hypothetical protein
MGPFVFGGMLMKYYALEKGKEFKIALTTPEGANHFYEEGWTLGLRPYDTHADAEQAIEVWKSNIQKLNPK